MTTWRVDKKRSKNGTTTNFSLLISEVTFWKMITKARLQRKHSKIREILLSYLKKFFSRVSLHESERLRMHFVENSTARLFLNSYAVLFSYCGPSMRTLHNERNGRGESRRTRRKHGRTGFLVLKMFLWLHCWRLSEGYRQVLARLAFAIIWTLWQLVSDWRELSNTKRTDSLWFSEQWSPNESEFPSDTIKKISSLK